MGKKAKTSGKVRRRQVVGTDYDQELWSFFSGGYAGEAGLKSALGGQLDRLINETGPSTGGEGDGWTNMIRMGGGPSQRLELGKVPRALAYLLNLAPPGPKKNAPIWAHIAYKKLLVDWPHFYAVLKAYYTRVPHGSHQGLIGPYGEFSGTALVVPVAQDYIAEWCKDRRENEICESKIAIIKAHEKDGSRLQEVEEELLRVKLVKSPGWPFAVRRLTKKIEAMKSIIPKPDNEASIRVKWRVPTEFHRLSALRELAERADVSKDTADRKEARKLQHDILEQAKGLWRAARTAYMQERRRVDREIRFKPSKEAKDELLSFKARLKAGPEIQADMD